MTIENCRTVDSKGRLERLEKLSHVSREIMGNLGTTALNDRLSLIARHARTLLEAESCGVLLVKREGVLSLEAGYGHIEKGFEKGKEFVIRTGTKTGLTGHIAYEGKLFNSHGDELIRHPAARGTSSSHLESGECFSLLAVPLKKRDREGERLIGLLRVDNKKAKNGVPSSSERFDAEDEWLLNIFAETVVVAIESAELVNQLNAQKSALEQVVLDFKGALLKAHEAEERLNLLLKAGNVLTRAEELDTSLRTLAEMIVSLLKRTFCRISLLEEDEKCLVIRTMHPIERSDGGLSYQAELRQKISLTECPAIYSLMQSTTPMLLKGRDTVAQQIPFEQVRLLHPDKDIQSLLLVPLRVGDRAIGMMEIGELRRAERGMFTAAEIDLVSAVVAHTVNVIDHMRQHEISERRRVRLSNLDKSLEHIRADKEWSKLVQEVVRQAAYLVDCKTSCLYLNHPGVEELELIAVFGLAADLVGSRIKHGDGLVGSAAVSGHTKVIRAFPANAPHESLYLPYGVRASAAVPLKQAGQVEMVLVVADTKVRRLSGDIDDEVLHLFAARAFVALEACRLMKNDASALQHLVLVSRIGEYAQVAGNLGSVLNAVLTGVTAGYGLGFNRAALFIIDELDEYFVGKVGIGHLDTDIAQRDWEDHKQRGLEDLGEYLLLLEQGDIPRTPIGQKVPGMQIRKEDAHDLMQIVEERRVKRLTQEELDRFPANFMEIFQPGLPLVVAPLRAKGQGLGFLIADNKFTGSPITDGNLEALADFAKVAANAIVGDDREGFWKLLSFEGAHILEHPISTLGMYLGPLARRIGTNPEEALGLLGKIESTVEQAKRIIRQVKLLMQGQVIAKLSTDIIPLIETICDTARAYGITVDLRAPAEPQRVLADPIQLSQCFDELVTNARRWIDTLNRPEKRVEITITRQSPEQRGRASIHERVFIRINFQDNGPGVPKEIKERIFDPFFGTFPGGHGFGLSYIRKVILGHGGLIKEVGSPGEGANFEIYLPLAI